MVDSREFARPLDLLAELAGDGPARELAIGAGRVALPLTARGVRVSGIELARARDSQSHAARSGARRRTPDPSRPPDGPVERRIPRDRLPMAGLSISPMTLIAVAAMVVSGGHPGRSHGSTGAPAPPQEDIPMTTRRRLIATGLRMVAITGAAMPAAASGTCAGNAAAYTLSEAAQKHAAPPMTATATASSVCSRKRPRPPFRTRFPGCRLSQHPVVGDDTGCTSVRRRRVSRPAYQTRSSVRSTHTSTSAFPSYGGPVR